jgi:hypothetical protein
MKNRIIMVMMPAAAGKMISALGKDFFWIDDVLITGVGRERANVSVVALPNITRDNNQFVCCVRGGDCNFLVALTEADWRLVENYLRLTHTPATSRTHALGNCVVKINVTKTPSMPK